MLVPWAKETAEGMTTLSLTYEGSVRRGPFASPEPDHALSLLAPPASKCEEVCLLFVLEYAGRLRTGEGGQWCLKENTFPVSSRALRHPRARPVHTVLAFSESILWASSLRCLLKTQAHWSVHPKGPQVSCDKCIF